MGSPAQCLPLVLVFSRPCFNGSLVLLYLFFSGNRWVKYFLKINSSSNAHFLGDNSHHLLNSNGLSHFHASFPSPQSPSGRVGQGEGVALPAGFTEEETEAQRGAVSWSRSQEFISGHGSSVQPVPWHAPSPTPEPQSPALCSVHQGEGRAPAGLVSRELGLSQGQGQGGAEDSPGTHRIPSPPDPACHAWLPSLPNPEAPATTHPTFP